MPSSLNKDFIIIIIIIITTGKHADKTEPIKYLGKYMLICLILSNEKEANYM